MKTLGLALLVVFGLYAAVVVLVFLLQRSLMFAPSLERVLPSTVNGAVAMGIQEVTLRTPAAEQLYCWSVAAQPGRPTILYLHGNGGAVSTRLEQFRQLTAKGYGVFMLGYPGYGGSDGAPSETAFVAAAHLAYQHILSQGQGPEQVVIYGESLGSAVAVQLAADVRAAALVLASPMASILEIAQAQYPILPVAALLKDPFLSMEFIDRVHVPVLMLHGDADRLIPIASGRRLFARANMPKEFQAMAGAGHNNLYAYPVVDLIDDFLRKHIRAAD